MNDGERSDWVDNDEGLYREWKRSRKPKRVWIKENRKLIDECIRNVTSGKKPAHYLEYGPRDSTNYFESLYS
jgi:hypothetical protein